MAEVMNFPDTLHREWRILEAALREAVGTIPHDPVELEHALAQIKPVYLSSAKSIRITVTPGTVEEALRGLNDWVEAQFGILLLRIFQLEVELYRLRGPGA